MEESECGVWFGEDGGQEERGGCWDWMRDWMGRFLGGVEVPEDEELIEDEKERRRRGGLRPLQGTKEV